MAAALDIGALSGRIELDDRLTPVLDLSSVSVEQFDKMFSKMGGNVASQATAFFTAEVAIKAVEGALTSALEVLHDMTVEGAAIADVRENFERLNDQAGRLSGTLLNELKEGTHNTIDDFELMKLANQDLAAGMNLSDKQFRTLADGAFALAQATGTDVATALDTMNDAMLTGRTRALALLTGKIDLTKAEDNFAKSLGTTADHLTEEGKLQAARIAILDSVGKATERLGKQTDGLDEMIAQAETAWKNFYDGLSEAVATSPNVIHAFEAIRDALAEAFGSESQSFAEAIVEWINYFADQVAVYGPVIIHWFKDAFDWVRNLYKEVIATWNGLPEWFKNVATNSALATAGLVTVSGAVGLAGGGIESFIGIAGNLSTTLGTWPALWSRVTGAVGDLSNVWKVLDFSSIGDAVASVKLLGSGALAAIGPLGALALAVGAVFAAWEIGKTEAVSGFFEHIGLRLQGFSAAEAEAAIHSRKLNEELLKQAATEHELSKATKAAQERAAAAKQEAEAQRVSNIEASNRTKIEEMNAMFVKKTEEEVKKLKAAQDELNSSGDTWKQTVAEMDQEMVAAIKTYIAAGVSQSSLATVYGVTATQITAVSKALQDETESLKLEERRLRDSDERWANYYAMRRERSGTATDLLIADMDRWVAGQIKSHQQAKTDTADFYEWLNLTTREAFKQAEQQRLEDDTHSKAHWEKVAREAQDAFEFARKHSDQFSQAYISDLEKTARAAQQAADNWKSSMGGALTGLTGQVRTLSGEMISLEESIRRLNQGFSYETDKVDQFTIDQTPGGAKALLAELKWLQENLGTMKANIKDFRDQNAFFAAQARFNALRGSYDLLQRAAGAGGKKPPGFADGGIGDFGDGTLAMLHGKEAIIPLDKAGGLGAVTNHIYVNGTAEDVARKVSDQIMRSLKQVRQFGSA